MDFEAGGSCSPYVGRSWGGWGGWQKHGINSGDGAWARTAIFCMENPSCRVNLAYLRFLCRFWALLGSRHASRGFRTLRPQNWRRDRDLMAISQQTKHTKIWQFCYVCYEANITNKHNQHNNYLHHWRAPRTSRPTQNPSGSFGRSTARAAAFPQIITIF